MDGDGVGIFVGEGVTGELLGDFDGMREGALLGRIEGDMDGLAVVGLSCGDLLGPLVGLAVTGDADGGNVGDLLGFCVVGCGVVTPGIVYCDE